MREQKHRNQIEKTLRASMKQDRARVKIGKISKFGLLELSRQRLRPSIDFGSMETCSRCGGKGQVPSAESLGLRFLRKLKLDTLKADNQQVVAQLPAAGSDLPAEPEAQRAERPGGQAVDQALPSPPGRI